ncbi:MAG: FtsL-like putative cell division protein [Flavobacteriales bacterium]|nr:FtsL-like putative cell division protein [Flavobacteriales bacterium]
MSVNNTLKKEKAEESESVKSSTNKRFRFSVMQILNGEILQKEYFLKNLPFLFYVAMLLAIYIANVFYAENKIREIALVEEQIKELHTEYISLKASLTELSKEHQLDTTLSKYGITVSTVPPKVVPITKEESLKIY